MLLGNEVPVGSDEGLEWERPEKAIGDDANSTRGDKVEGHRPEQNAIELPCWIFVLQAPLCEERLEFVQLSFKRIPADGDSPHPDPRPILTTPCDHEDIEARIGDDGLKCHTVRRYRRNELPCRQRWRVAPET